MQEKTPSPTAASPTAATSKAPLPDYAPDSAIWFIDPHWAAAFPTDSDLIFYAAMPTKELLPEFKRDPTEALISFLAGLPEPPPIREARLVEPVIGKIEMPNRGGSRSPRAWRWSATRRWPPTRCSASAAAGPSSRANGSPTRSRRRCAERSRSSAA